MLLLSLLTTTSVGALVSGVVGTVSQLVPDIDYPGTPWTSSLYLREQFHQGFAIDPDNGNFITIDNGTVTIYDPTGDNVLATNSDLGVGDGSFTDGTVYNGELVFRTGFTYVYVDLTTAAVLRTMVGGTGGSTLCKGPDSTKLYSFSYGTADRYWVIDPATGTAVQEVLFDTPLSTIQGSVWSPEDYCFYVTDDSTNTLHRVAPDGTTTANYYDLSFMSGVSEGLDTFRGRLFVHEYQGTTGIWTIQRSGDGLLPVEGPTAVVNGGYIANNTAIDLPVSSKTSDTLDVLLMTILVENTVTIPVISGWTELHQVARGGSSGYTVSIQYKLDAGETSVTIPDLGSGQTGSVVRVSGVDTSIPPQSAYLASPSTRNTTTFKFPQLTPIRDNARWIGISAAGNDASQSTENPVHTPYLPDMRGAEVVAGLVHPWGSGGCFGVVSGELPYAGIPNVHSAVSHFDFEQYRASFSVLFEAVSTETPPPSFTVQPSIGNVAYVSGDTVTIDLGSADNDAVLAVHTFKVGGVDRSEDLSGNTWTGTVSESSTIELVVSATNAGGTVLSDTTTATYYAVPTFVGASTVVSGVAAANTNDSVTVDLSSITGLQEGDVVVVQYSRASIFPQTLEITDASWLSELDQSRADGDDSNMITAVKVMGASPDASVTIDATTTDTAGNSRVAVAHAYRGVDVSNLDAVLRTGSNLNNTAHVSFNAITPTVPGSIIVVSGHSSVRTNLATGHPTVGTVLDNVTEMTQNAGNRDVSAFMGHVMWDGTGTYDPGTINHNNTASTNSMASVMRVFEPAEPA